MKKLWIIFLIVITSLLAYERGYSWYLILLGFIALLNIHVSIRLLFYHGCSFYQKIGQLIFVWLFPMLGALFVYSVIKEPHFKPSYKNPNESVMTDNYRHGGGL